MAYIISPRPLNKVEHFITTIGNLGGKHNSVSKSALIDELIKDPRFTLTGADILIDKMYERGVIYQPLPDYYKLVS